MRDRAHCRERCPRKPEGSFLNRMRKSVYVFPDSDFKFVNVVYGQMPGQTGDKRCMTQSCRRQGRSAPHTTGASVERAHVDSDTV
jgi:hypothetical protein